MGWWKNEAHELVGYRVVANLQLLKSALPVKSKKDTIIVITF